MNLTEALHLLDQDEKERIFHTYIGRTPDNLELLTLSTILLSFQSVSRVMMMSMPPAFSILRQILSSNDNSISKMELIEKSRAEFELLTQLVSGGQILGKKDASELYRNVLREARRSDLLVDNSEAALLAVLRNELRFYLAQHYLTEYHSEFMEFWISFENSFTKQIDLLKKYGMIFESGDRIFIPDETAQLISISIGFELSDNHYSFLLSQFTNGAISEASAALGQTLSGTKEERIRQIIFNMVPATLLMGKISLELLKDMCKDLKIPVSGTKEVVIERLIHHYKCPKEQASDKNELIVQEEKFLAKSDFLVLFRILTSFELKTIVLGLPGSLKSSGTKDALLDVLWRSSSSEKSILSKLSNTEIDDLISKLKIKISGSKSVKIDYLLESLKKMSPAPNFEPTDN